MFPPGPDGFVFTAPKGGPIRRPAFYRLVWSKATQAVGLEGFPFRNLRHTGATLALQEGTNPVLVAFPFRACCDSCDRKTLRRACRGLRSRDRRSAVGSAEQVAQNSRSRPRLVACRRTAVSQEYSPQEEALTRRHVELDVLIPRRLRAGPARTQYLVRILRCRQTVGSASTLDARALSCTRYARSGAGYLRDIRHLSRGSIRQSGQE